MTSPSNLDIQMIMLVNAYDIGQEGTIEVALFQIPQYFVFHSYDLDRV